ncbi:formate C-acetyltransferase/glycerol dehydratase family glycyl radical enzyme [Petroclostridium sp. X23]|uniref:glycyl radical protein n=1 Tax=Petroclostridium sp. X23 TaxID=3045146 RepID=UPI0024ACB217|nr:formate C-acetyltransferase/glycerol dehydratase family glycyl radical enzyme [Petroclostridium sp. X23]WHH59005.1 formate C-acetyltransferase/glycerol dehydratase family glycyl radical enzyme [Petroclostridium sp. X23]
MSFSIDTQPSVRIEKLKKSFLDHVPHMCCQRAEIYTKVYKEYECQPMIMKRAIALKETLRRMDIFIDDGEMIVGYPASKPRSAEVFPEISFHWINELDEFDTREYNQLKVLPEVKEKLREIYPYWRGKTLTDKFQVLRPENVKNAFQTGLLSNPHEWSGLAHVAPDFKIILQKGIKGILEDINDHKSKLKPYQPDYFGKMAFYSACEEICNGVLIFAERYKVLALEMAEKQNDSTRKSELLEIARVLAKVPLYPAETFHEALQSFWLIQLIPQIESNGFSITPGRFDQYMYPFYQADIEKGNITREWAQELLDCLWLKFCEILRVDDKKAAEVNAGYASGQNLVVGGIDSKGKDSTNDLSYMCLTSNAHIGLHQPNFTVRVHKNTPDEFLTGVVECISKGNGMPQLLNDELIIPSLMNFAIPLKEAREYIPVGCDEITVYRMWARCNGGYINFAKVLEVTMNNGKDILNEKQAGLEIPVDGLKNFDEFKEAFIKQLKNGIEMQVTEANLTDFIHKEILQLPFISMFVDNCIQKGRDVTDSGAYYNTTGLVGVGAATCGDSLHAINEIVYNQKRLSLAQFRNILKNNFAEEEVLRRYITDRLDKFGNDSDEVDSLVKDITDVFFDELEKYTNFRGGRFWPALYSVAAQVGLGDATAATPDGRLARFPLSDGLTPMYGQDKLGPTAALKSVCKVDLVRCPNGVIVNQRMMPGIFKTKNGIEKMKQLIRSFVDINGFHWQFNVINNDILKDAQINPENYKGLVVRVAGYSAIFVQLSKKAQDSVIARNEADL